MIFFVNGTCLDCFNAKVVVCTKSNQWRRRDEGDIGIVSDGAADCL